jgi:hypothetical protein
MTASGLVYVAAGTPPYPGACAGLCRLCGAEGRGLAWEQWVKDTFTGHDTIAPGSIICQACQHATDDRSAPLTRLTGRGKPQRMRNYSHIVTRSGVWRPRMKHEKRALCADLLDVDDPPVVAVVSLAGQKHLLPRARVGWWQIEEATVRPQPAALRALLAPVTALYTLGATKSAIESGVYASSVLRTLPLATWWQHEQAIRPARGSQLFALAVWLAQRDEVTDDDRDARPRDGAPLADLAGDRPGLQEQVPHVDLAPVRRPGAQRRLHDHPESLSQPDLFAAAREPAG